MIKHPRLGTIVKFLRPDWRIITDYIVQQDAGDAMPWLAKNGIVKPITQDEVDAVTDKQLMHFQAESTKAKLAKFGISISDLKKELEA